MRLRLIAVIQTVFCLAAGLALGQVLYGNLIGIVTDPQQAAVVGASVSIKNNATGFSKETKTDDRGGYEIVNNSPGRSGEGRVGEECRSRGAPDHLKKKKK